MKRSYLMGCVGVFVATYSGSLAYFWFTDSHRDRTNSFVREQRAVIKSTAQEAPQSQSVAVASAIVKSTTKSVDTVSSPATLKQKSAESPYPRSPAAATEQPMDGTVSPARTKILKNLSDAMENDHVVAHRLAAITKLRILAGQGDTDGKVRTALDIARSDVDPEVADAARKAYEYATQQNQEAR